MSVVEMESDSDEKQQLLFFAEILSAFKFSAKCFHGCLTRSWVLDYYISVKVKESQILILLWFLFGRKFGL